MASLKKETIENLAKLISINSVSSLDEKDDKSNLDALKFLAEIYQKIGFDCRLEPIANSLTPRENRKFNLICQRGCGVKGIIFSGHIDTVNFNQALWESDALTLTQQRDRYYGLGVSDMKSFFPLIAQVIEQAKIHPDMPIVVVATADEEISMAGIESLSHKWQIKPLLKDGLVIIGEPTNNRLVYSHKGIFMQKIIFTGQGGHSSDPEQGRSALEGMIEFASSLLKYQQDLRRDYRQQDFSVAYPTINLGKIEGGDSINRICDCCSLYIDVRLTPGMSNRRVQRKLHELAASICDSRGLEFKSEILFKGVDPLVNDISDLKLSRSENAIANDAVAAGIRLSLLADMVRAVNLKVDTANYATEGPFFQQLGLLTVVLGPGDIRQAHRPNEWVAIKNLEQALTHYQNILEYFSNRFF